MMRPLHAYARSFLCRDEQATHIDGNQLLEVFQKNCSIGAMIPTPALFTRISMPPKVRMVFATANRTASVSAASALTPALFRRSFNRANDFISLRRGRAVSQATAAPSAPSRLAMAAPIPRERRDQRHFACQFPGEVCAHNLFLSASVCCGSDALFICLIIYLFHSNWPNTVFLGQPCFSA